MAEDYPSGDQDPMRFWIEQVAETMGTPGRNPDGPPPADSVEHQLYSALMKEVVYGVPYNPYFAVEPGGRTRFTDPATGSPLGPGEVPPSITADRMLREGLNHISMEGRRLRVQHLTHDLSPGRSLPLAHPEPNFTRIAGAIARKGGVFYINPPFEELAGEAKITGLPVDVNDAMQKALNTVAVRVHYGFFTDPNTVVRIDEEIDEILPTIGKTMGPSMQHLATQIRGTGVEVQLLGMDRSKGPGQLLSDIRRGIHDSSESKDGNSIEARVERIRSTLTLRNYTEWHLLGEIGADLAQRGAQKRRRIREAAILTPGHYANLAGKLDERVARVRPAAEQALTRLQTCGQRGYVDPADFLMIFRQE